MGMPPNSFQCGLCSASGSLPVTLDAASAAIYALGEAKWAHHAFCWGMDDQYQRLSEIGDVEKLRRLNQLGDAVENALQVLRSLAAAPTREDGET